ncbi:alpha/beta fold hydrolase, partial [Saccharothrix longispora]|uniref:alpha/beta fold hydrolase n=1 Tax=Saccharothrix longispora TaxID=33920 RepID=UPI0028FD4D97
VEKRPRPLGSVRVVSVTGEALKLGPVHRWFARFPDIRLVNAYGATEVSDDTMHEILDRAPDRDFVTVGTSRRNVNTYVLDPDGELVPLGAPGEIAFSGVAVGRGYINDPERTELAFVPDPHRPGTRMYRTGDFGRWLPERRIEFLGRRDQQVKIRGFRIEIGEIENRLLELPDVRDAAVVVDTAHGGPNLVAFCTGGPQGVRESLAAVLPEYMVPAYVHHLDALPLTENGKVDKRSLTALAATLGHNDAEHVAPGTAAERELATVWAEVLGVPLERIGRTAHFFELGGTSLAAVRLVVKLDRGLSLRQLAATPVLSDLAAVLAGGDAAPAASRLLHPVSAPVADPVATLVCFPYAGGNAVNFRVLADELRASRVAVLAVELPGHDFAGDSAADLAEVEDLARRTYEEITAHVTTPVLLWGHCAGAAHALATARLLEAAGADLRRVYVGALLFDDVDQLRRESTTVTALSDRSIAAQLLRENAYVELDELKPERAALVGAAYRHDVCSTNRFWEQARLTPPVERLRADLHVVLAADDPTTKGYEEKHRDWELLADRTHLTELADGGHYFIRTQARSVAATVAESWR